MRRMRSRTVVASLALQSRLDVVRVAAEALAQVALGLIGEPAPPPRGRRGRPLGRRRRGRRRRPSRSRPTSRRGCRAAARRRTGTRGRPTTPATADTRPAPRSAAAAAPGHDPILLTLSLVLSEASSKMPLKASHIAAPRNAMISTAMAAEITPSPRSSARMRAPVVDGEDLPVDVGLQQRGGSGRAWGRSFVGRVRAWRRSGGFTIRRRGAWPR